MTGGFIARFITRGKWQNIRRSLNQPRGQNGFTIIEVLIVLAVTGFLFIGAALLIAGRRQQAEFNQSIRQVQSQIQQIINDVATGYYPNTSNFVCSVSGPNPPLIQPGASEQGKNSDCIFMGRVMQFQVANTNPEQFKVYTLVGRRLSAANPTTESVNRATALPVVIAPTTTDASVPDNSESRPLLGGLTTVSMVWGASSNPIGAIGFMQSLAKYSGNTIQSGAQSVIVIPVAGTSLNATSAQAATDINTNFATSAFDPADGVRICFASGGTNQSGLISIGGGGRQLSVTLDIKSNKTCS